MTSPGLMGRALRCGPSGQTLITVLLLGALAVGVLFRAVANPAAIIAGIDVHVHSSWEAVNRLALESGQFPFWNPYAFGGYPGMSQRRLIF